MTEELRPEIAGVELLGELHHDVQLVLRATIICVLACAALTGLTLASLRA